MSPGLFHNRNPTALCLAQCASSHALLLPYSMPSSSFGEGMSQPCQARGSPRGSHCPPATELDPCSQYMQADKAFYSKTNDKSIAFGEQPKWPVGSDLQISGNLWRVLTFRTEKTYMMCHSLRYSKQNKKDRPQNSLCKFWQQPNLQGI